MNDEQAVETPPLTLSTAVDQARADERRRCIAFLRREADRSDAASMKADGPEAEVRAADSVSFAAAASLLAARAGGYMAGLDAECTGIEVAQARTNERQRIAQIVRAKADEMQRPGSKMVALSLADLICELGP